MRERCTTTPLAVNIWRYRTLRGFRQDQLAERVGISRVTYGKIERGKITHKDEVLDAISDALGVSVNELLRPDPKPRKVLCSNHGDSPYWKLPG